MLSIKSISRLVSQARHSEVIGGCLRASMPLPLSIRLQLESEPTIGISALALGLARSLELCYRLDDDLLRLGETLLSKQLDDGSFSAGASPAVDIQAIATLCALRGSMSRDPRPVGIDRGADTTIHRVDSAIGHACGYISALRAGSAEGLVHDEETSAFLMVTVARFPRLYRHIDPEILGCLLVDRGCMHNRRSAPLFKHARALMSAHAHKESPTPKAA